jgi:hypothetical protein
MYKGDISNVSPEWIAVSFDDVILSRIDTKFLGFRPKAYLNEGNCDVVNKIFKKTVFVVTLVSIKYDEKTYRKVFEAALEENNIMYSHLRFFTTENKLATWASSNHITLYTTEPKNYYDFLERDIKYWGDIRRYFGH